jgi:hypothetical protein
VEERSEQCVVPLDLRIVNGDTLCGSIETRLTTSEKAFPETLFFNGSLIPLRYYTMRQQGDIAMVPLRENLRKRSLSLDERHLSGNTLRGRVEILS